MTEVRLCEIAFHRLPMTTRFPFRYGIATMVDAPHLFVRVTGEVNGRIAVGLSADGLPPKWFTKNPNTTFEDDDLPAMLQVIRHAADAAREVGRQPSFFRWWHQLYQRQQAWAHERGIPPLLAGFGVSLIERAMLDALCRSATIPLFDALQQNLLEIDLGEFRPELQDVELRDILPSRPRPTINLRHTIGLGDSLRECDLQSGDRPRDGLPFTLEENIKTYGLRYFKIKLTGDVTTDCQRLCEIASLVDQYVKNARITLDGNENFRTISHFRETWDALLASKPIKDLFARSLLFVEQPVHRSAALSQSVGRELRIWHDAPRIIIDESDAEPDSLPAALSLGYSGTSHKNCKGIIKGVLAAATIRQEHARGKLREPLILSAEDLGNVGPVALLQDLAVVSALDISHAERNGHHYFAGLSMFPEKLQRTMLEGHADLYHRRHEGFAAVAVRDGVIALNSVNRAPFGLLPLIDVTSFDAWDF